MYLGKSQKYIAKAQGILVGLSNLENLSFNL